MKSNEHSPLSTFCLPATFRKGTGNLPAFLSDVFSTRRALLALTWLLPAAGEANGRHRAEVTDDEMLREAQAISRDAERERVSVREVVGMTRPRAAWRSVVDTATTSR